MNTWKRTTTPSLQQTKSRGKGWRMMRSQGMWPHPSTGKLGKRRPPSQTKLPFRITIGGITFWRSTRMVLCGQNGSSPCWTTIWIGCEADCLSDGLAAWSLNSKTGGSASMLPHLGSARSGRVEGLVVSVGTLLTSDTSGMIDPPSSLSLSPMVALSTRPGRSGDTQKGGTFKLAGIACIEL